MNGRHHANTHARVLRSMHELSTHTRKHANTPTNTLTLTHKPKHVHARTYLLLLNPVAVLTETHHAAVISALLQMSTLFRPKCLARIIMFFSRALYIALLTEGQSTVVSPPVSISL